MAAQRDAGSQLSRVCTAPNQRRHPLDRRPPPALPLAALISSTVAAVVGAVMTGLQYSELANWDGRVSIASASGGNAFTPDRELESPLPSGSSPSSRPCAGSLSSSESQRAGAVVQGDVCHKDLCAPPTAALPSPPSAIGAPPAKTKDAPMDMDVDSSDTAEERVYAGQDRMIVDNGTHDASAAVVTDAVEAHGRYSPPFTPGASQRTVTPLPRSAEDSSTARMGTEKEADAHLSSVHAFKNMGFTAAVMSRSSDTPQPHPQEPTPPQSAGVSPPRTASSPAPDQPDEDSHDPLAAEEEASSLLDADGETDNESTTSYHVVPLPTASQSSTTPKTAASSEQQMAIQNAPSHGRHKKASQGTISDEHRHITQVVDPGPIASTSKLPSHTPPRTIRPSEKAQAGAIAPRRKTPLFVDSPPPTPPLGISERANPYKRRKLNYAYVEIPPLPAGRRRAGYRPAATILVPQDPVGDDYASQLGQVLNHASIINARGPIVSASPMPKRRGRPPKSKTAALSTVSQKKNARQTKSVSVAPSAVSARSIDGSASVSKVIPRKRGRLPKVKDEHQASEAPVPNVDGIPPEVQEEAQDQSLRSEKSPEVQPRLDHPADSLETLIPSTPIDIGMYPVPSLTTDMVAYRHLLEVNPAPPSPPRSPQLNRDWVLEGWPPAPVHAVWAYHFWPPAPPPLPFACPMPVPEPVATEKSTEVSSKPQGETSPRRSTSPNSSSTAPSAAPGVDALAPRYAAYPHMPYSYGFPYLYPYPHPFPLAAAAGTPTCEPDAAAQKALPMLPLPESRPASAPHDPAAHPSPSSSPSPPPLPRSPSASPQAMVTKAQVSSPAHSSLSPSRSAALGEVVAPIPPHRRSPLLNFAPGANEEPASVTVSRVDVTQKEPALSHEHSAGPTTLLAGTAAPSGPLTASSSCNSAQPMDQNSQPVVRAPEKLSEALAIPPSSQETRTPLSDAISKPETDPHSFDYSDAMNMDMLADLGPSPSPPPGMTPDNSNSTSNGVSSDAPQSPARQQDAHSTSTAVTNVNASDHHGTTAGLIATSGTSTLTSQSYRQFQYSPELLREIAASVKKRSPKPNGHEHRGGPSGACVAPMDVDGTGSLPWMLDAQRDPVQPAVDFDFGAIMQAAVQQADVPFGGGGGNGTINPALLGGVQLSAPEPDPLFSPMDSEAREQAFGRRASPLAGPSTSSTLFVQPLTSTSASASIARPANTAGASSSLSKAVDAHAHDSHGTDSDSDSEDDRPLAERLPVRNFPFALPREMAQQQKEREETDKRTRMMKATGAAAGTKGPVVVVDLTITDDEKEEDDVYVLSSEDEYGKGKGKGKEKGKEKGKGKAQGKATDAGKGKGKSQSKAKPATGSGRAKDKGKAVDKSTPPIQTFRHRAEGPTFCHQCRSSSVREKMRCTTLKGDDRPCGLRYCDRCVDLRYPDVIFNQFAVNFKCPRCLNICNCTSCCARRGEQYISARVGRLPPPGSIEALALLDEVAGPEDRIKTPTTTLDLPPGAYFGVVYDVPNAERLGLGYVGKTHTVMLQTDNGRSLAHVNTKKTLPMMKKQRRIMVVAYIGKRRGPEIASVTPASASDAVSAASQRQTVNPTGPSAAVNDPLAQGPSNQPAQATCPPTPPLPAFPGGRMYIGKRSVLDSVLYVSVTELVARALRQEEEEEDESFDMYMDAPPSDPLNMPVEDAGPLAMVDIQCAVAIALSSLGDSSAPSSVAWSSALSTLSDLSDVSMG